MNRRQMAWWLFAILLFTCWPVLSVVAASSIATMQGCALNEGNPQPCSIVGMDVSGLLYSMGVMGWYGLATVPLGALALLIWLLLALGMLMRHWRARGSSNPNGAH